MPRRRLLLFFAAMLAHYSGAANIFATSLLLLIAPLSFYAMSQDAAIFRVVLR